MRSLNIGTMVATQKIRLSVLFQSFKKVVASLYFFQPTSAFAFSFVDFCLLCLISAALKSQILGFSCFCCPSRVFIFICFTAS